MVTLPPMRRMENEAAAARLRQNFFLPSGYDQPSLPRPPGMAMQQGMPTQPPASPRPSAPPQQAMPKPTQPQPPQPQQPKPQSPAPIKSFRDPAPQNQQFKIASAMPLGNPNQSDRPIYPTNPVPPPRPQPQPQPQYPQPRPETPMPRNNYLLTRAAEEANLRGRQIGRFQDAMRRFGGNRTYALHYALRYGA